MSSAEPKLKTGLREARAGSGMQAVDADVERQCEVTSHMYSSAALSNVGLGRAKNHHAALVGATLIDRPHLVRNQGT